MRCSICHKKLSTDASRLPIAVCRTCQKNALKMSKELRKGIRAIVDGFTVMRASSVLLEMHDERDIEDAEIINKV